MGLFIGVQRIHCRSINALIGCVVGVLRAIVRVAHCVRYPLDVVYLPFKEGVVYLPFKENGSSGL